MKIAIQNIKYCHALSHFISIGRAFNYFGWNVILWQDNALYDLVERDKPDIILFFNLSEKQVNYCKEKNVRIIHYSQLPYAHYSDLLLYAKPVVRPELICDNLGLVIFPEENYGFKDMVEILSPFHKNTTKVFGPIIIPGPYYCGNIHESLYKDAIASAKNVVTCSPTMTMNKLFVQHQMGVLSKKEYSPKELWKFSNLKQVEYLLGDVVAEKNKEYEEIYALS